MTTRAELRASARLRLEDSGGAPLYTDATLNDYITQAIRLYGRWAPLSETTTVTVAAAATTVDLPATILEHAIVAVRDATGADVLVMNGRFAFGTAKSVYTGQAWRVGDGKLWFQRAVSSSEAGTWTVDSLIPRPTPTDDVAALSIDAGDEPVVIELVIAASLKQRSGEDYKRGAATLALAGMEMARDTTEEARRMFAQSRRRAVGGWMGVA